MRLLDSSQYRPYAILATAALVFGKCICASTIPDVVVPNYTNTLSNDDSNPEATASSSMVLFSGSVGPYFEPESGLDPTVPTAADSGITLSQSAIAQPFSAGQPYPNFVQEQILLAQDILYPDTTQTREQIEGSGKAFRYKPLLFNNEGESAISSDFERIADWYGDPERSDAETALEFLANGLKFAPGDPTLRNAILDAYYDLAVAEIQFVKVKLASLAEWRLGFLASPSNGFIINEEIALYQEIVSNYQFILQEYGQFLNRRFATNVNRIDPNSDPGIPFGAYVFQNEQERRNQFAVSFIDEDGILKTVPDYDPEAESNEPSTEERQILSGYKDFALLITLLRDYADSTAELARLYGLRRLDDGTNDDVEDGLNLIATALQELFLTDKLLRNLLGDYAPELNDGTGIAETLNGLQVAKSDLNSAQTFLIGETNALGFDPDFLVLIQEFPDSTEGNQFDSYDAMIRWIRNTDTSPLNFAQTAYDRAFENYEKYKGFADQVFNEFSAINTTTSQRYFEITGYDPDEAGNHRQEPRPGSELFLIDSTINQLQQTNEQLQILDQAIQEGMERARDSVSVAEGLAQGVENALYDYQGTIRKQRDNITQWSAYQAASQATYETVSDVSAMAGATEANPWGATVTGVVGAVNVGVQYAAEKNKGDAEKLLDLAGAEFDAALEINDIELVINQAIENRDSLQREQISNTLQVLDNQSLLSQELSRRANAFRELDRLINNRESTVEGLANRYYADPVHFLRSQNDMIKADNAFRDAQEWVFYTVRALEFKWNSDFVINYLDKDWSLSTLFKLRNYLELQEMVAAMERFNTTNLLNFNREQFVDKISLRDDILAPHPGTGPDDGMRYDFVTDETVTATELMRRKLDRNRDENGNIEIRINTFALDKRDGFFFLGPEYNNDGSVFSAGKYLDKIDWIKLNAVTTEAQAVRTATISYAGTCYIRNRVPPCLDTSNPFELNNEYRRFPFRYFFTLDNGASWQTRRDQQDTVKLVLSPDAEEPEKGIADSTLENNFLQERSVATTDLIIRIQEDNLDINQLEDFEIYINHLFVSREVPFCN